MLEIVVSVNVWCCVYHTVYRIVVVIGNVISSLTAPTEMGPAQQGSNKSSDKTV